MGGAERERWIEGGKGNWIGGLRVGGVEEGWRYGY
jgi:hypothetical protein